jgi:hypothetical protein
MGLPFIILSDQHTLGSLMMQKNLLRQQAQWTEALVDYDFTVVFIPGEKNTIADAMSHYSFSIDSPALIIAGLSEVSVSTDFVSQIKTGYTSVPSVSELSSRDVEPGTGLTRVPAYPGIFQPF